MSEEGDSELTYEWKDYLAFIIALLQTIFLPLLLVIFIFFVLLVASILLH